MRLLQRGIYKGRKFEMGKMVYAEKDTLNTEKSFKTTLKILNVIRKEAETMLYGKVPPMEKNIYGKRKVG
ncbi:MAG: hypothetical protein AUJ85_06965 [Elusimicrobia bacterium CG1_02_37_114]|nr:MAG: hypothetical protein AUJ85_06965 [Elusimicrobia bacterium CG1_02_37_114]